MEGGGAGRATALGWWLRLFAWPHLRHPLLLELKQEAEASVLKSGASPGHRDQPAVAAGLHWSLCVVLPLPLEWGPLQEAEGRGSRPPAAWTLGGGLGRWSNQQPVPGPLPLLHILVSICPMAPPTASLYQHCGTGHGDGNTPRWACPGPSGHTAETGHVL